MEIRNSVAIFIGLRAAKQRGIRTILTGDGADELFAGYSYLYNYNRDKLELELKKLSSIMRFSAIPLAKSLEMEAKLPFLEPAFKEFAQNLDPLYKIRMEKNQIHGKWILRKAYEEILPASIAWRTKTPIEVGSGTTILPDFFHHKVPDIEFNKKRKKYLAKDRVTIRDKEQLFYYEIYRSIIGVPHPITRSGKICPQCNSDVDNRASYCPTCGAYPI